MYRDGTGRTLVDILFSHVYCRIANVVDAGIVQRHRASHYMKELIRIGVLTETKSGRDKLFVHQKYLALLIGNTNQFSSYTR